MLTRKAHYKAVFGVWWVILNTVWTLLSSADTLVSHYASKEFKNTWDSWWITPRWGWKVWAIGLLIITTFLTLEITYKSAAALQEELSNIKDGIPKLVCKGVSHESHQPIQDIRTGQITGIPVFYHLRFENCPAGISDRKTARRVAGTVEIRDLNQQVLCARKLHRWEHQPGPVQVGKMADLSQPLDMPPSGVECKLDIAMKHQEEDEFYTPTNDSGRYTGFRDPRYKFGLGEYIADVHLSGENVNTQMHFKIINRGRGTSLEIEPLTQHPA